MKIFCLSLLALLGASLSARAEVKLAPLFADGAVLQRDLPIPVWGSAAPGEIVSVSLGGARVQTTTGADGAWKVVLPKQSAATGLEMTVSGQNTLKISNVGVGEVWLCSGQSNMQYATAGPRFEDGGLVREFYVSESARDTPSTSVPNTSGWKVVTKDFPPRISAVSYGFAHRLAQELKIPVGIILATVGGTSIEMWMSQRALDSRPELSPILAGWRKQVENYPRDLENYNTKVLPAWEERAAKAKAAGLPEPSKPSPPRAPDAPKRPMAFFNGMIAPLAPYAIRGALWYQGESSGRLTNIYGAAQTAMITDWRATWGQGDFPFFWVQLPGYQTPQTEPVEPKSTWALLREAQESALALPNTGMIVALDLWNKKSPDNIHPPDKSSVAQRLANLALARVYGVPKVVDGPIFQSFLIKGNELRLQFQNAQGMKPGDGELRGFAICGAEGVWKWASARIEGSEIVLSHPEIAVPVAARYGWAQNPIGNLVGETGLPARPFRTDKTASKP